MEICTIVARNYLAAARVLARSFAEHNPRARSWTLVIDDVEGEIDAAAEPFEVLRPEDLGIDIWARLVAGYSILELSTAVKPWLLRHLLNERGCDRVTYLDPDIQILGSIADVDELLTTHAVVVNPHLTAPMPRDGYRPSETDILVAGSFNLGFAGFARGDEVDALLDWWAERLATDCLVAPERGYFVDQRWMDFAPGLVPSLYVLRDPGYNVAYWNLPSRDVLRDSGGYTANGRPLRFMHFSGYDPAHPGRLSKHQDRVNLAEHPVLRELCDGYGEALRAAGHELWRRRTYAWDALPDGTRLDGPARSVYRDAVKAGALSHEDIFSSEGGAAFLAYLRAPAGNQRPGVSRYLYALWETRADLRQAFPDPSGRDGAKLVTWAAYASSGIQATLRPGGAGAAGLMPAVNVAGYLTGVMGTGEHARQLAGALRTQKVPITTTLLHPEASPVDERLDASAGITAAEPPAFNLLCVNADSVPTVAAQLGPDFFRDRYTIGFWAWEVSAFPTRFLPAFAHLDEVWVGSQHVRDAVAPLATVPVIAIPQPVSLPPRSGAESESFPLPGSFSFLFAFDYLSVFERKNALGAVEAFSRAFPPGSGVALTIKCLNGDFDPTAHARLRAAVAAHDDVHLLERPLSASERDGLMSAADGYVSLHRAEGFGYTLAEAMWLGKPVIATGYSGNVDYMTDENSYLVDYSLIPIGPGHDPYPPDGVWAQPDLDHAARLMREVFENREEAARRGARAAQDIRSSHGPQAAGQAMAQRLQLLMSAQALSSRTRTNGSALLSTDWVAQLIHSGPRPPRQPRFGTPQRAARKGLLRLLKPLTVHERMVDGELLKAIESLDIRLRALGDTHSAALAQIDLLKAELGALRGRQPR